MDMAHYFATVKTFEDYEKLRGTGMLWELFSEAPLDWKAHQEMKLNWDYSKWVDKND